MRPRNQELNWNHLARWWPQEGAGASFFREQYLRMCAEDLGTSVWWQLRDHPLRDVSEVPSFVLRDSSEQLTDLLEQVLPQDGYGRSYSPMGDQIATFAKGIAQGWLLGYEASFEVGGGWDGDLYRGLPHEVRMLRLPQGSLRGSGQKRYQYMPPGSRQDHPGGVIALDARRVICMQPPTWLHRLLVRVRTQLLVIGGLDAVGRGDIASFSRNGETFIDVAREFAAQRAKVTKELGWSGRGLFDGHMTAYHQMLRRFQWERNTIQVRNAIVGYIRDVFSVVGSWCHEQPRLLLCNFPTVDSVSVLEERFVRGELSIAQVDQTLDDQRARITS